MIYWLALASLCASVVQAQVCSGNCELCDGGSNCLQYFPEYTCPESCLSYNTDGSCTVCQLGYYMPTFSSHQCKPCPANCFWCGADGDCKFCQQGYLLSTNTITKVTECKACSGNCSSTCEDSSEFKNCSVCGDGYGISSNGQCEACSTHCSLGCNVTGASKCDLCDLGYGYTVSGSCGACTDNCKQTGCYITGAGRCDRCDAGYGFTANGSCMHLGITVEPTFGPVAGRTEVNVTVKRENMGLNSFISTVYIGSYLNADITNSGGVPLTVSGSNLNSVAHPRIRALVVVKRLNNSEPLTNETFGPCEAATANGTQMICYSPIIYILEDLRNQLFVQQDNPYANITNNSKSKREANSWWREKDILQEIRASMTSHSRSKRSSTERRLTIVTNNKYNLSGDILEILIGILLDGVDDYKNNIFRNSDHRFDVAFPPSFLCSSNIEFDPKENLPISIQGKNMSLCCDKSAYTVRIGDGFCNVTNLTDNALNCLPPQTKPRHTSSDSQYDCRNDFAIFVHVGNKINNCACLSYKDDDEGVTKLIIIVVVTVGGSLVIFVIVVTVAICIKSRLQKQKAVNSYPNTSMTRERNQIINDSFDDSGRELFHTNKIRETIVPSDGNGDYNDVIELSSRLEPRSRPTGPQDSFDYRGFGNGGNDVYRNAREL